MGECIFLSVTSCDSQALAQDDYWLKTLFNWIVFPQKEKLQKELSMVKGNLKVMTELLNELTPGQSPQDEVELLQVCVCMCVSKCVLANLGICFTLIQFVHPLSVLLTFADCKTALHYRHLRYHVLIKVFWDCLKQAETFDVLAFNFRYTYQWRLNNVFFCVCLCVFVKAAAVFGVQEDADSRGGAHPPAAGRRFHGGAAGCKWRPKQCLHPLREVCWGKQHPSSDSAAARLLAFASFIHILVQLGFRFDRLNKAQMTNAPQVRKQSELCLHEWWRLETVMFFSGILTLSELHCKLEPHRHEPSAYTFRPASCHHSNQPTSRQHHSQSEEITKPQWASFA